MNHCKTSINPFNGSTKYKIHSTDWGCWWIGSFGWFFYTVHWYFL